MGGEARCPRLAGSAPVAQLDRASVYGTEGREFESLRARGNRPATAGVLLPGCLSGRRRLVGCERKCEHRGSRARREWPPKCPRHQRWFAGTDPPATPCGVDGTARNLGLWRVCTPPALRGLSSTLVQPIRGCRQRVVRRAPRTPRPASRSSETEARDRHAPSSRLRSCGAACAATGPLGTSRAPCEAP